jgi:hypothetical protein
MTGPKPDAVSVRSAVGLANVCRQLDELRQLLDDDGDDVTSVLHQLLAAVRAREPDQVVADLLDELNEAVQDAGDMAGIFGFDTSRGDGAGLDTLEVVYRCPLRRCAGRVDADHQPLCAFSPARLPLLRERL